MSIKEINNRIETMEKKIDVLSEHVEKMATNCIPTINRNMEKLATNMEWITWFIKVVFWGIIVSVIVALISTNVAH